MSAPRLLQGPDLGHVAALLDRLEVGPHRRCAVPECLHRPAPMGPRRAMGASSGRAARATATR